ncbi:MAG: pyrroloquinoline quinone biosynthesis protein PqqE [Lentisphaerae bacterium ADurb.Bin242]|nr:MAG: pyrroloquinoline quinone biosynthesis protein PqqE [Lentisphaerae bacterium ADurb.Bin242]
MIPFTQLKNTHRHNLMEVLPLPKPYTVLVEPSSLCNFRCIQCFQSLSGENYFTRTRMNMPLDRFVRVIEQLKAWPGEKLKVLKLSLYGEPLLNPAFCEMLRIARKADLADRIETTSNVSRLTPEIAEAMVRFQLDYLRVSIYSPDEKRHREITSSSIKPAEIHENLRVLREIRKRLYSERPFISPKMLESYGEENERFMKMYADVGDEIYIDKPHSWIKVDEEADFMKRYYADSLPTARQDFSEHSSLRIACPMAFTTMAIRANGDVSPCCIDFIGGTNLGNVDQTSLRDLWESDEWFEFQKMQLENRKHENSSCAHCDIYRSDHYTRDNIDGFPVENLKNGRKHSGQ